MRVRFLGLASAICIAALSFVLSPTTTSQKKMNAGDDPLSQVERDLLNEINQCRAHPQAYASYLEKLKPFFNGKQYKQAGEEAGLTTHEGWSAVDEAIKFLRDAKPLGPLSPSRGLSMAALVHMKDQSSSGATGHRGADSALIEQRLKPFGTWQGAVGENLTYGAESARDRVLTWLIDDGFPSRGHRRRLLSSDYKVAGISCGPHPEYQAMCVLDLATSFVDKQTTSPATNTGSANKATSKSKPVAGTKSRKL